MLQQWNERYGAEGFAYGKEPNVFFKEQISLLQPGSLFVPGAGEGRDVVYAAAQGWNVVAVDQSLEGKRKALQLATAMDVSFLYEVMDISDYDFSTRQFDAIALIYFHLPAILRADVYPKLAGLLKPGGTLILEAFHPKQLGYASGGPKDISMLITAADLDISFASLDKLISSETEVILDEGPYHQGPAFITRYTGRKR